MIQSGIIYRHTHLSRDGDKARWRAYFDCLARDQRLGIATTDDERSRFMAMWERGDVVWRDDGSLMACVGLPHTQVPDAVFAVT